MEEFYFEDRTTGAREYYSPTYESVYEPETEYYREFYYDQQYDTQDYFWRKKSPNLYQEESFYARSDQKTYYSSDGSTD